MKVIHIVLQDLVHVGFRVQLNAVWICILRYMNAVPYLLCTPSLSQLDGELMLATGFPCPPNSDYPGYHTYIDENLPPESPTLYGLHPNAEIGFLTTISENLFRTVLEMQPRDSSASGGSAASREEKVWLSLIFCMSLLPCLRDFGLTSASVLAL